MKKSFIILLAIFFVACSNDNENPLDKQYELFSVEWKLGEGDGEEIIKKELPDQEFKNTGEETVKIKFSSTDEMDETSQFKSNAPNAFPNFFGGTIEIPITDTAHILSDSYSYLMSSIRAPYQSEKAILEPTRVITEETELHPKCKITYKRTVDIRKITASYRICFVEKTSGESYEVEGKWIGEFYAGGTSDCVITPID